jgi:hypothetical protein
MKNKIAIASAFIAASSFSMGEIVVNDFLSFEGFVDSAYTHTESDASAFDDTENSFGVNQVEISWLFNLGSVTAQIDIDSETSNGTNGDDVYDETDDGSGLGEVEIEQAFVNLALANGDVVTVGRYASMLGFEAYEPTGLYQASTAYDIAGYDFDVNSSYVQGVKYTRTSDTVFLGVSLQDQSFGNDANRLGGDGDGSFGVEVAASIDLGNGFSIFAGGTFENAEEDTELYNAYVTYETGAWLFAAELNLGEGEQDGGPDVELRSGLLMANYAYSDIASVTARFSDIEVEVGGIEADITKYTLAHNYAFTDNLLLVTEVSYADGDLEIENNNSTSGDVASFAAHLVFSF